MYAGGYEAAISEVNAAGLHLFYDLGVKLPPRGDPAFSMIVSMGVAAIATPLIGPSAFTWAGSFGSAALGSAAIGVTSRFAGGIVTNRGRIDKAFKDVTSKESLRNIGLDSLSAGVCAGLESKFKIAGLKGSDSKTLRGAQMHVRIAQQHAIRGVVNSAVYQQNIGKSMEQQGGSLVTAVGQDLIGGHIAANSHAAKGAFHAGFGGLVAKAQNRSVVSGVIAGATAEVVATGAESLVGKVHEIALASTGAIAGGITLAAGGDGKDVAFSSTTAMSAIMYNHEAHKVKVRGIASASESMSEDEIARARSTTLIALPNDEDKALFAKYARLYPEECQQHVMAQLDFLVPPILKQIVNWFLPADKQIAISVEEMTSASVNTASGMRNMVQRPRMFKNLTYKSKPGGAIGPNDVPANSKIQYLGPGNITFNGVEFKAIRNLNHLSEEHLWKMQKKGINPYDIKYDKLIGHHYKQQYHRLPNSFIMEIPESNHCISNRVQHPFSTHQGLTKLERADWDKLRIELNKIRATDELFKRGLIK